MEQGTGKTIPTLCRILELLKTKKIQNYLVCAPKSALSAWERDIELFDFSDQVEFKKAGTFINYDRVWRNDFDKQTFDLIVLDEGHFIKNRTSRRSKAVLKMATRAKYKYLLSGTIISNGQLENIWSLLAFLDPYIDRGNVYSNIFKNFMESLDGKTYKGSYQEFINRYCILNMYHKPSSYIHVNELQEIIDEHSYRVKKVNCLDLPDKLPDDIIKVDLLEKTLYKKLATESALIDYDILAENPLSRMIKLRQLASGHIKLDSGELIEVKNDKLNILEELFEGYEDNKKVVIFAEFKYSIRKISELLAKKKIKYIVLDGDQKDKTIWRKFQSDKSIRVIVCQYQTASAGIDLFSSDTIIFYEPTLRSNTLEQARDRIHRTGQKNKCSYIHLLTRGTIEVDIYRALAGYSDFNERLFSEYMESYRKNYK
jgi:SNF2 family DNA or RNA helicase